MPERQLQRSQQCAFLGVADVGRRTFVLWNEVGGARNIEMLKPLQVYYVVDKPSGFFWKGGVGYITEDMVRQHLPPPSADSLILVRAGGPGSRNKLS